MRTARIAVALATLLPIASAAYAADAPALPNPILTPGAIDPAATPDVICTGRARDRRHVTAAEKNAALDAYSIPRAQAPYYEFDHLIPLAIGGANTLSNLWPQPWAEADEKDVLEVELQRLVCHGVLSQAEAQREIADDWTEAYRRYAGRAPVAAARYDVASPAAASGVRPTLRARLEAALRAAGAAVAVVTMGARGCLFADADGERHLPAPPARLLDSTGAGDAFCGTLAALLAQSWPLITALEAAQRVAARTVERPGAYAALPPAEEWSGLLEGTIA